MLGLQIPLSVVALGVITGLTYALLGVLLVLTYKTSRVLNFALGEMGALSASVVPVLVVLGHWPYWLAVLAALVAAAATGAFMEYAVIRKFARGSRLIALVATIGAAQLFFVIGTFLPHGASFGAALFPTPFQSGPHVGSLRLTGGDLLIVLTVPVTVLALAAVLRYTRLGVACRCAAENGDAAALAGVPIQRVSLAVWVLTGVLAGVGGILNGPSHPIISQVPFGPALLLRGLAAAMIAGLTSLRGACAAGVGIGVLEAIIQWNYPTNGTFEVVLFLLILVTFLVRRRLGESARGGEGSTWSLAGAVPVLAPAVARLPLVRRLRACALAGTLVAAALLGLPANNGQRVLMSAVLLFAMMGLSIVVLTGFAGQISLGQFAFVGLGAIIGGRMHELGYPAWEALLYSLVAGGGVALLIGLPALRIRGLLLAVITLALGVATSAWVYGQHWLVHQDNGQTSLEIPRPSFAGIDFSHELNYYLLCLLLLSLTAAAVHRIRVSGLGRAMMAVRDNEPSAAAMSVSPRRAKLAAFAISGVIAAGAGYFYGGLLVNFSSPTTFGPDLSLALLGMVILGGVTTISGAILGAVYLKGISYVVTPLLPNFASGTIAVLLGGMGLLGALYQFPAGAATGLFNLRDSLLRRLLGTPLDGGTPTDEADAAASAALSIALEPAEARVGDGGAAEIVLQARDIAVAFGGNRAVDGATITVRRGEIVGLVGPNGAGKSTLFDLLSGHVSPQSGVIELNGEDISGLRPESRARLGLGRTFQQARLFEQMTLHEVLKVPLERNEPSELVPSVLGLMPSRRAEARKTMRVDDLVELLGLSAYAGKRIHELSTGVRRIVELGCLVALGAEVLLLDEPTAGVAQREVEAFRPVLLRIRDHLGASIVIVEHDLPLIMSLVDRLYVMNVGQVLAEGEPEAVRADPAVIAAYLGTDERVIQRSGTTSALAGAR